MLKDSRSSHLSSFSHQIRPNVVNRLNTIYHGYGIPHISSLGSLGSFPLLTFFAKEGILYCEPAKASSSGTLGVVLGRIPLRVIVLKFGETWCQGEGDG